MFEVTKETLFVIQQTLRPLRLSRWQLIKLFIAHLARQLPLLTAAVSLLVVLLVLALFGVFTTKAIKGNLKSKTNVDATKLGLPVVSLGSKKDHRKHDFHLLIEEGARQYPNEPYVVKTTGLQFVVFPPSMFDEIKRLHHKEASAQDFFEEVTFGKFTHIGSETDALLKTLGVDLARGAPTKVHMRQEDCSYAFTQVVGQCDDWTEIDLLPTTFNVIATMNACAFVGRELGRTKKWVTSIMHFPITVMIGAFAVSALPGFLRTILAPILFIPSFKVQWDLRRMLKPVLKKDLEAYDRASDKKEMLKLVEGEKMPITAWLLSRYKERPSLEQLTVDYLLAGFESTPSSAATSFNILADLAAHQDVIKTLREEIEDVMVDGKLPLTHLAELRLMDSAMRESFRMNPFSLFTLYRRLREPVQLSTGPPLPPGTIICVDSHSINKSKKLWNNPDVYQAMRWHELRKQPGNENKHLFVSMGADAPNFGDGTQACPGRFYASSTIKIVLCHFLMNYDLKLRPGEGRPKKVSMPNGSWAPDFKAKVLIRSRKIL